MNLINRLENCKLEQGEIAISWLCQAGFVLKDYEGVKVAIDPYLSHCGQKGTRFIRLSPIIIDPEEFDVDVYLATHRHFDHFDLEAIPIIAGKYDTKFFGSISCVKEFEKMDTGKVMGILNEDDPKTEVAKDIFVQAVFADHGELEPDAVGFTIEIGGFSIYITGDTAYRPDKMEAVKNLSPDILIAAINGQFGNMDYEDGAKLAEYTQAKSMVPCHIWTLMEHMGNPELIAGALESKKCDTDLEFLSPGEIYKCKKNSAEKVEFIRMDRR